MLDVSQPYCAMFDSRGSADTPFDEISKNGSQIRTLYEDNGAPPEIAHHSWILVHLLQVCHSHIRVAPSHISSHVRQDCSHLL